MKVQHPCPRVPLAAGPMNSRDHYFLVVIQQFFLSSAHFLSSFLALSRRDLGLTAAHLQHRINTVGTRVMSFNAHTALTPGLTKAWVRTLRMSKFFYPR
jgi:hypothetical protein